MYRNSLLYYIDSNRNPKIILKLFLVGDNVSEDKYLKFLYEVSKSKPNSIRDTDTPCPFCNRDALTDILDKDDPFIFLKNKYATIEDTLQTVIIETKNCSEDMSMYSKEHMRRLINFAVDHWLTMEKSGKFKSVILFKNHGPQSGGSIKHSHMQIVGLKHIDYKEDLKDIYFQGATIYEDDECHVNLSTYPMNSFTELNVICKDINKLNGFSENIQNMVHYILHNYYAKCSSFNLFFYQWKDIIICKVVPRFVVSPLLIGFSLKQISNNNEDMINTIRELYYTNHND